MKRKRSADNSMESEPEAKKFKRTKPNKLEKDLSIGTYKNKRKAIKDAAKINFLEQNQFYSKSGSEINNNELPPNWISTPSRQVKLVSSTLGGFAGLSEKTINSEDFKILRGVKVLLDGTVVDNYFRTRPRSLSTKSNQQTRPKRRVRRSKMIKNAEKHGQKTLLDFYNFSRASSQNSMINSNTMMPLISIKQEDAASGGLIHIDKVKLERVSIYPNDLAMLYDTKVNLKELQALYGIKTENETILSASNNKFDVNETEMCDYYQPETFIKGGLTGDVSIDENLAKIKIEDVSPMKMEVSDESFTERQVSWYDKCQPCFTPMEAERMCAMKITDALTAISDNSTLAFYDGCPDEPMEEISENGIAQTMPGACNEAFNVYPVNSGSSLNSSRSSWHVSDESGIFTSDDSANFNELSNKFNGNSSFNCPVVGNEESELRRLFLK